MSDISVDCVVFGYDENQLKVLLIEQKRVNKDAPARYALPGDLVYESEGLDAAAARVLKELTSLENVYLEQFRSFGDPNRVSKQKDLAWLRAFRQNPDVRVITVGYYSLVKMEQYQPEASSFAKDAVWMPINNVPELAFDHNMILNQALAALRSKFKFYPVEFQLLPKKFTLSQLQELNELILEEKLDKRNFRRKALKLEGLVPLDEKQKGVLHKPAQLYSFAEKS
jgi:8-oxo-dGTP diphosphatase